MHADFLRAAHGGLFEPARSAQREEQLSVLFVFGTVLEVSALGKKYFNECAELVKVEPPKDEQREDRQLAGTPESVLILWVSASVCLTDDVVSRTRQCVRNIWLKVLHEYARLRAFHAVVHRETKSQVSACEQRQRTG